MVSTTWWYRGRISYAILALVISSFLVGHWRFPRFVLPTARSTLPWYTPVRFRWTAPGIVLLCTVATCCWCLALGSYVTVFLALEALPHSALPLIPLALENLALPDQAFVDYLVCVFGFSEFDGDSRCGLSRRVSAILCV